MRPVVCLMLQKRSLELSAARETDGNYLGIRLGLSQQVQPTTYRPLLSYVQPTVDRQVQQYLQRQPILEQQQRQVLQYQPVNYQSLHLQGAGLQPYQQPYQQSYGQQLYQPQDTVLTLQPPPLVQPQLLYDSRILNRQQQYQIGRQPQSDHQILYRSNLQNLQEEPSVQILPSIALNPESHYRHGSVEVLNNQMVGTNNLAYPAQTYQQPIYLQPQPTPYQPLYQPNNYLERRSFNYQNPYINHP